MNSPFDERKYKRLLKGLEISEVFKSELERTKRIDSEFYKKENLQIVAFLKQKDFKNLTDVVQISDGNHMSISEEFIDKGIPYYRGQDIHNFFIENASPIYIPEKIYNAPVLKRSHLKKNDILLSIVGTIGKIALVTSNDKATCSCKLAILRPKNSISSELLAIFLISKYGQNQIQKFIRGAVQMGLILEDMDQLFIPVFTKRFDVQILKKVQASKECSNQSQFLYRQAEDLLLETIGLSNFKPGTKATNLKSFKKSFLETGRLDAEYYQPKYEKAEKIIKKNGFVCLEDICSAINYGSVPTSPYTENNNGIPYIKGLNLKSTFILKDKLDYIVNTELLPSKVFTKEGDIIISQMGTVGDVGIVTKDEEGWIFASFTIRARLKIGSGYLPRFIGLYIQNIAKNYYLQQNIAQASVRQNTDLPTIRKMYIPKVDVKAQREIVELIEKSFSLRKKSDELLEEAKKMVERKIEEGK